MTVLQRCRPAPSPSSPPADTIPYPADSIVPNGCLYPAGSIVPDGYTLPLFVTRVGTRRHSSSDGVLSAAFQVIR